jgi:hypothetical protein
MPHYLQQVAYSQQGWEALVANPQNRIEAVRPAIEKLGGKIEACVVLVRRLRRGSDRRFARQRERCRNRHGVRSGRSLQVGANDSTDLSRRSYSGVAESKGMRIPSGDGTCRVRLGQTR